jgi:hypothetical protein
LCKKPGECSRASFSKALLFYSPSFLKGCFIHFFGKIRIMILQHGSTPEGEGKESKMEKI